MNWQKYAFLTALPIMLLGLSACSESSRKYRDTSEIEQPPQVANVSASKPEQEGDAKADDDTKAEVKPDDSKPKTNKGLSSSVSIADDTHLLIDLPFDQAWRLVKIGLELSGMTISDRNREKGQYYVEFDPDTADQKSEKETNIFTDLFKTDDYPKGRYLLTFLENPKSVKVNVEFLEYVESKQNYSSQDGHAQSNSADNGVAKLLKKLYLTLHDDLPLD